jgi:hypothetical protein
MMKKYGIELKWGVLFTVMTLLWMMLEKGLGWHDELIAKHAIYTNFVALPAIAFYVIALIDKRKNYYKGQMSYLQGFLSGFIISLVVMFFSPLTQVITFMYITPNYFENIIRHVVTQNQMSLQEAENYFNLSNYITQSALFAPLMGIATSALVALFVKRKAKS